MNMSPVTEHKKVTDTYILAIVLGLFGGHHFYLGRWKFGLLYVCTLGLFGIGYIYDLFRLKKIVAHVNYRGSKEVLVSDVRLICLVFGLFGIHHMVYLGNRKLGVYYLLTLGSCGVGWIVDLWRTPELVKQYNDSCSTIGECTSRGTNKSLATAYILAMPPFGILGTYHWYLGNRWRAVLYLCTGGMLGLGWIVDLFQMYILVSDANRKPPNMRIVRRICYALWATPLGIFGAHHFVLGRRWNALFYLLTFGVFGVDWAIDLKRLPVLLKRFEDNDKYKYCDEAYMYWLPFGFLGLHQFYLGRKRWGLGYLATFGIMGVGLIFDGFRMKKLVEEANRGIDAPNGPVNVFTWCGGDAERPPEITEEPATLSHVQTVTGATYDTISHDQDDVSDSLGEVVSVNSVHVYQ